MRTGVVFLVVTLLTNWLSNAQSVQEGIQNMPSDFMETSTSIISNATYDGNQKLKTKRQKEKDAVKAFWKRKFAELSERGECIHTEEKGGSKIMEALLYGLGIDKSSKCDRKNEENQTVAEWNEEKLSKKAEVENSVDRIETTIRYDEYDDIEFPVASARGATTVLELSSLLPIRRRQNTPLLYCNRIKRLQASICLERIVYSCFGEEILMNDEIAGNSTRVGHNEIMDCDDENDSIAYCKSSTLFSSNPIECRTVSSKGQLFIGPNTILNCNFITKT